MLLKVNDQAVKLKFKHVNFDQMRELVKKGKLTQEQVLDSMLITKETLRQYNYPEKIINNWSTVGRWRNHTTCQIFIGEELVSTGLTILKPGECFSRRLGRQHALSQACANLPKELRPMSLAIKEGHRDFGAKPDFTDLPMVE